MEKLKVSRKDYELPLAVEEWGWRFHHLGIPTDKAMPGETYLVDYKLYFSGFDSSPFGIEWMRYEEGCPVHELIRTVPHIAFEVDKLDLEIQRLEFKIITPPNSPSEGVRVAMIEHNGAPIELIEFTNKH
jgi:hypothetical protein